MCCWSALLCQVTGVCGMALVSRIRPVRLSPRKCGVKTDNPIASKEDISHCRHLQRWRPWEKSHSEIVRCQLGMDGIARWIRKSAQWGGGTVSIPQLAEANPRSRSISSHWACSLKIWLDLTPVHFFSQFLGYLTIWNSPKKDFLKKGTPDFSVCPV